MADIARLTQVIEPEAEKLGFDLVRVKMTGSGDERALQIMAEDPATGQLVVEQCMALSRAVSDRIDAVEEQGEVLVEGAYNLEVSSPGIDRPLTRRKDFKAWAGHDVNVSLTEKVGDLRKLRGELKGMEGDNVLVEDRKHGTVAAHFDQIHSAKLVLTDKLIAASKPQDMSGADEIIEQPEETEEADD